jgi:hypothetical protein
LRHAIRTIGLLVACSLATSVAIGHVGAADAGQLAKRKGALTVSGNASGLYPGASVPLRVRVRNRRPAPLVITRIKVRTGTSGGCSGSNLDVLIPKRRGRLRLRAHSAVTTTVSLRMLASAPDACQGARIPLRFKVRAKSQ